MNMYLSQQVHLRSFISTSSIKLQNSNRPRRYPPPECSIARFGRRSRDVERARDDSRHVVAVIERVRVVCSDDGAVYRGVSSIDVYVERYRLVTRIDDLHSETG